MRFQLLIQDQKSVSLIALIGVLISISGMSHSNLHAEDEKLYGQYSLQEWQQIVKSTDFKTLGNPETVDGLIEIVADSDAPWANRRQAAKTLGRIGSPAAKAVPLLKELLLHPGEDIVATRLWVLSALSLYRTVASEVATEVSDIILDSDQPHLLRVNAMEALGRVGKESEIALSTFAKILQREPTSHDSPPDELRLAAAEAVWILGPSAAPLLPLLINNARDDWSPIRLASIVTIGEIGPRAEIAIPLLTDTLLFDDAHEVKEVAADSLGKIGVSALPTLSKLQQDRDESVRRYVIRALEQSPNSGKVQQLLQQGLLDSSKLNRVFAAKELLKRIPEHDEAQILLLGSLDSNNRDARLNAYNAIFELLPKSESLRRNLIQLEQDLFAPQKQRFAARKLLKKYAFDQE